MCPTELGLARRKPEHTSARKSETSAVRMGRRSAAHHPQRSSAPRSHGRTRRTQWISPLGSPRLALRMSRRSQLFRDFSHIHLGSVRHSVLFSYQGPTPIRTNPRRLLNRILRTLNTPAPAGWPRPLISRGGRYRCPGAEGGVKRSSFRGSRIRLPGSSRRF
mgnify:CR=1 FL=1